MVTNDIAPLGKFRAALFVVKTNLIHFVHAAPTGNRGKLAI
jgi:hypothetical protein